MEKQMAWGSIILLISGDDTASAAKRLGSRGITFLVLVWMAVFLGARSWQKNREIQNGSPLPLGKGKDDF
jgi:hypothetical protein